MSPVVKDVTYRVGSVPYVNAVPLVYGLEQPSSGVEVMYAVPSQLPALLESGQAQAVMVSSIEALRLPHRQVAQGVGVVSQGPVLSVRLFSKVPFSQIQTLALDSSSLTSNRLAQIVLASQFGAQPETVRAQPDLAQMLASSDACVLIGDTGMAASGENLLILDLGDAWTKWTGLPFVWALWVGDDRLTPDLAVRLREAAETHWIDAEENRRAKVIQEAVLRSGWTQERCASYLQTNVQFRVGSREIAGLSRFADELVRHGHLQTAYRPTWVEAIHSTAPSP